MSFLLNIFFGIPCYKCFSFLTIADAFILFFFSLILTGGLGKDHEILRRRIENGAKELWFFLQSELKKLKNLEGSELQRRIDEFLSDLGHQERYLY